MKKVLVALASVALVCGLPACKDLGCKKQQPAQAVVVEETVTEMPTPEVQEEAAQE